MKQRSLTLFAFMMLSASFLLAQDPGTRTPPTPAEMIANRVARLTTLLTLTPAQQTQATTIFTNEQTAESSLLTSIRDARTALQTAIQKNDLTGINTQATQIGSLTTQQ